MPRPGHVVWLFALALVGACDGPVARSKPWRHAGDQASEAPSRLASLVGDEEARVLARERRATTLRIHVGGDVGDLSPLAHETEWAHRILIDTVFEPLVAYVPGPDRRGEIRPRALSSWTVSPDGRELRLELAPDRSFHDGKRVTSLDVQFSIDMARLPRGRADHLRPMLADISTVELVTPRVVRVRLSRPNGYVLRAFAELPVLPAHVYEGKLGRRGVPLIGSGPYRLETRTETRITLQRWDGYGGTRPAIESVVYVLEGDAAVALTAAKRGEIDIVPALIPSHYPGQAKAPGVSRDFSPLHLSPAEFRYLAVDLREPPLDDLRVRRAVSCLVRRQERVEQIHRGLAQPIIAPVWPGGPVSGEPPPVPDCDGKDAALALDAAGWRADGSGVRRRDGERLKLDVLVTEESSPERDDVLAELRKAGIATDIRVGSPAVLRNRLREADFDLAFIDVGGFGDRDLGELIGSGGKSYFGGVAQPEIDHLLGALALRWRPAERWSVGTELGKVIARDLPIIPLWRPAPYGLVSRRVTGLVPWNGWFSVRELSLESEP